MATNNKAKKPCCKCNKGGSTFTCNGCDRSFCSKHAADHREELVQQIDILGQQHNILKRDVIEDVAGKTILAQIDRWEEESIHKIRWSAEKARADLQRFTEETKIRLNISIDHLSSELRLNQENDDYTEEDLDRWTKELQKLRKEFEEPSTVTLDEDKSSALSLLRVQNRNVYRKNSVDSFQSVAEKFSLVAGSVVLSDDHCYATCTSDNDLHSGMITYSSVYGHLQYSQGIFNRRFRLYTSSKSAVFLGIITSSVSIVNTSWTLPYVYGFWTDARPVSSGQAASTYKKIITQLNDQVTLVLDCPSSRIIYIHERTQQRSELQVNQTKCPFPWKLVLNLWYPNDKLELLEG